MSDEPTERDVETRAALRREIGPPTDRDDNWQPMVSAGEVRTLLDTLADHEAQIRDLLEEREELLTEIHRLRRGNHPAGRALNHLTIAEARAIALAEERDAEREGGDGA